MSSVSFPILPFAGRGQRIGLLGGSFDPPHLGHIALSRLALARLQLDWVWWLITPRNPLKSRVPSDISTRLSLCEELVASHNSRIKVVDFESSRSHHYTCDSLDYLRSRRSDIDFVWLMGADNLAYFHLWHRWKELVSGIPIAIFSRSGSVPLSSSRFGICFSPYRLDERDAPLLPSCSSPSWVYLSNFHCDLSSSFLRLNKGC